MRTKACKKCGIDKPLDDYYKHPRGLFGYASECKSCALSYKLRPDVKEKKRARDRRRKNRKANPEYVRAYRRKDIDELHDRYVIGSLAARFNVPISLIKDYPQLVSVYRKQLQIKRHQSMQVEVSPNGKKSLIDLRHKLNKKIQRHPNHKKISIWIERLAKANDLYNTLH